MNRTIIRLTDLSKTFGGKTILDVDDLCVNKGEVVKVIGPNGSGKSTLLKIMALLEPPDRGEFRFSGKPIVWNGSEARKLRGKVITLVEQSPYFFGGDTANEVALPMKLRGAKAMKARGEAIALLAELGLEDKAGQPARSLSGGEQKRAALARAMLCDPDVLLLDEPFSELDHDSSLLVSKLLQRFMASREKALVLTAHTEGMTYHVQGRIVRIQEGSIRTVGPGASDTADGPSSRRATVEVVTR